MSDKLLAGVAGAGVFGGHHAAKYAGIDGVRLAAVHDVDTERARALAERYGAVACADYEDFLAATDIVTIASPATSHFTLAEAALEAGRHVLIEKPIALDLAGADRLNRLAADRGLIVQAGHQERFVFEAFGVLSRRRKPLRIACVRRNPGTGRGEDVSVVFDLMIHDLDLLRVLGLGEAVDVAADGDGEDLEARLVFSGGATASLVASRCAPARERVMKLVYDDGVIEIDFVNRRVVNSTPAPLSASFDDAGKSIALHDPLGYGVARFVAAVRGEAAPVVTGEEARDALEWALLVEAALPKARAKARESLSV